MSDEVAVPVRNRRSVVTLTLGSALLLVLATGAGASAAGVDHPPTGVRVTAGILGAVCLAAGVGCVVALVISVQRRDIVVDRVGVSWRTAYGTGWVLRWDEVRAVTVHTGFAQGRGTRRHPRVSVVLQAVDAGVVARHPQLTSVRDPRSPSTLRLPLADRSELVEPLADAFARFGAARFTGVVDDGQVGNVSYRPRP